MGEPADVQEIYSLFDAAQECNCTVFELAERVYMHGERFWLTFAREAAAARSNIQWQAHRRARLGLK